MDSATTQGGSRDLSKGPEHHWSEQAGAGGLDLRKDSAQPPLRMQGCWQPAGLSAPQSSCKQKPKASRKWIPGLSSSPGVRGQKPTCQTFLEEEQK